MLDQQPLSLNELYSHYFLFIRADRKALLLYEEDFSNLEAGGGPRVYVPRLFCRMLITHPQLLCSESTVFVLSKLKR